MGPGSSWTRQDITYKLWKSRQYVFSHRFFSGHFYQGTGRKSCPRKNVQDKVQYMSESSFTTIKKRPKILFLKAGDVLGCVFGGPALNPWHVLTTALQPARWPSLLLPLLSPAAVSGTIKTLIHWSRDPGAGRTLVFPRLLLSPPLWWISGSHTLTHTHTHARTLFARLPGVGTADRNTEHGQRSRQKPPHNISSLLRMDLFSSPEGFLLGAMVCAAGNLGVSHGSHGALVPSAAKL